MHANDRRELLEPDFLDLVDQAGLVLITGSTPAQGDCHAMIRP